MPEEYVSKVQRNVASVFGCQRDILLDLGEKNPLYPGVPQFLRKINIWSRIIFADIIVYIFPHEQMSFYRESIMLDTNWLQTFKQLVKLSSWWNFWLFGYNIWGEIGFQKLQNFWVAKVLMSSYILCKILSS